MADMKWRTPKDPDDVIRYQLDWATAVTDVSDPDNPIVDPIVSAVWTVPAPLLEDTDGGHAQTIVGGTKTRIWIKGGTPGSYDVRCRITTTAGEVIDRTVRLTVKEPVRV